MHTEPANYKPEFENYKVEFENYKPEFESVNPKQRHPDMKQLINLFREDIVKYMMLPSRERAIVAWFMLSLTTFLFVMLSQNYVLLLAVSANLYLSTKAIRRLDGEKD